MSLETRVKSVTGWSRESYNNNSWDKDGPKRGEDAVKYTWRDGTIQLVLFRF